MVGDGKAAADRKLADRTGFIRLPGDEDAVNSSLAEQLKKLSLTYLRLHNIRATGDKIERLARNHPKKKFDMEMLDCLSKAENINICICCYASLPDRCDANVESLSANTLQKMRHYSRFAPTRQNRRSFKLLMRKWKRSSAILMSSCNFGRLNSPSARETGSIS